ncbi:PPK2 family polyphosphate kinase [Joostella sp.]|uniref:PPK2 family polyphosphate kinase n=1 Tax=Joostella sp. TaxID=2231138 RepID=UPI003A8E96DB
MDSIKTSDYRIDEKATLANIPTLNNLNASDDKLKDRLKHTRKKLGKLQDVIYAHGKYSVLICLQGIDTAGKDSLVREVFKDFNSRGVLVHSFKVPTELERKHDYLWRHYIALPGRGKFGVFNRTHYENVLVTRVHPEYVLGENIPGIDSVEDITDTFWDKRFEEIKNFEKHISDNGTIIFKFFLHLSKGEQKNRLLRRLNLEEKNWKFSPSDLKERALWDEYQVYYEEAINKTTTPYAPWYVVPADNKKAARAIVANILYDELKEYKDIAYPELDPAIKEHLSKYREQLNNE